MSLINILQNIVGDISSNPSGKQRSSSQGALGGIADSILGQLKDGIGRSDKASTGPADDTGLFSKNDQIALGAGALAVLLGRRNNSNMSKLGGLAALGTVAFRAYQRWQQQQQGALKVADAGPWFANTPEGQDITELDQHAQDQSSRALIAAIILAARADGQIDPAEQELIEQQTQGVSTADEKAWISSLLNAAVDPKEVAQYVDSPAIASQVYALSLAVINEPNFMERSYLDELARQLSITEDLKAELERELKQQTA